MKKLLLLTVALTSFMAHAMESTKEQQPILIPIPNPLIAQTPLGTIYRMQINAAIIVYELKTNNNKSIAVTFDEMRKEFRGAIHTIHGQEVRCEPIESQAEVKAQFDTIKAAFDVAPNKTRKFNI